MMQSDEWRGNLVEGDILITNDAYITGSHLNHITMSLPIFHQGTLVGFACCMAHWRDVGGVLGEDLVAQGEDFFQQIDEALRQTAHLLTGALHDCLKLAALQR